MKGGALSWWTNDTTWNHFEKVKDSDAALLLENLGNHPRASVILAFQNYLADTSVWGTEPLARLNEAVKHFAGKGLRPVLFVLDPEFYAEGTWTNTHDVVGNSTARSYLIRNIKAILSLPEVTASVTHASTYWVGANCANRKTPCREADIVSYIKDIQAAINSVASTLLPDGMGIRHLLHVDGPFWDGCWPQPCDPSDWVVGGYSPASLRDAGIQGLLGESWVSGSLVGSVSLLIDQESVNASEIMLLCDVPNCDDPGSERKCATGSVRGDTEAWFADLVKIGVNGTWGVWDFVDGGLEDGHNNYGDALNDGSGLTAKGKLHSQMAMRAALAWDAHKTHSHMG